MRPEPDIFAAACIARFCAAMATDHLAVTSIDEFLRPGGRGSESMPEIVSTAVRGLSRADDGSGYVLDFDVLQGSLDLPMGAPGLLSTVNQVEVAGYLPGPALSRLASITNEFSGVVSAQMVLLEQGGCLIANVIHTHADEQSKNWLGQVYYYPAESAAAAEAALFAIGNEVVEAARRQVEQLAASFGSCEEEPA